MKIGLDSSLSSYGIFDSEELRANHRRPPGHLAEMVETTAVFRPLPAGLGRPEPDRPRAFDDAIHPTDSSITQTTNHGDFTIARPSHTFPPASKLTPSHDAGYWVACRAVRAAAIPLSPCAFSFLRFHVEWRLEPTDSRLRTGTAIKTRRSLDW